MTFTDFHKICEFGENDSVKIVISKAFSGS